MIFFTIISTLFLLGTGFSSLYLVGGEVIGTEFAEDKKTSLIVEEFRTVCRATCMEFADRCNKDCYKNCNNRCNIPVTLIWKNDRFKYYARMAPFYWARFVKPQIILLDEEVWNRISISCQKELVWHELGHAILGWGHHEKSSSLMKSGKISCFDIEKSFKAAWKIEKDREDSFN